MILWVAYNIIIPHEHKLEPLKRLLKVLKYFTDIFSTRFFEVFYLLVQQCQISQSLTEMTKQMAEELRNNK